MKTLNILKYIGFGILGIAFVLVAVFVTMYLWNWLVPELFNGPTLSFWQTAGLFILSKLLLSGVSPGCHHKSSKKDWHSKFHKKFEEKCEEKRMEREVQEA